MFRDFPESPAFKNPFYNAGDTDGIPGQGTVTPAVEQLGPFVLQLLKSRALRSPSTTTAESASHNQRTLSSVTKHPA